MLQKIIDKTDMIKNIFRLIFICTLCIGCILLSFAFTAVIISKTDFRYESLVIVTSAVLAVNALFCSFVLSSFYKENGLVCGIFVALIISLFTVTLSLYYNCFNMSLILLTKLILIFVAGAAGGVIGVNTN